MSEIKYRISSVTTQHPKYPASNLLDSNHKSGWQSQINCSYPQSLTIQFYVPIRTKKLQIMFHQYKIPQLIDVFVKLGARQSYRKLGYVVPTDNSQSSYEEKEEKTLYFEFSCTHIRLVLHQNYKCDMNIFNQVAIEDLIVIGQILSSKEIQGIDLDQEESSEDQVTQSLQISQNERAFQTNKRYKEQEKNYTQPKNSQTTEMFREIYAKIQSQKQAAVSKQEYQRAGHLKNILNNFKHLQNEINRLQREKAQALVNEDYDKCYRLKNEINKKKQVVEFQKEQLMKNQEQFYSYNSFSSRVIEKEVNSSNQSKKKEPISREINQFKSPQAQRKIMPSNPSINLHDQQILPALLNKGKNIQNLPLETNQKKKQQFIEFSQSAIPQKRTESDNASLKKEINDIRQPNDRQGETSIMGNQSFRDLEPLDTKLRMRVQNYFNFIPQVYWQLCQHKNWKGKLQALQFVKAKVNEVQTKQQFMAIFQIISRIIISKQATISTQSLQILIKLTELDIHFSVQHVPFFVEEIIGQVLHFFNDTNKNVKELALRAYLLFPRISFLNASIMIRQLIKHKNKVKNDPKLVITKLQLMTRIIQTYKQSQYNFKQILNWILHYIQDPNQKVRQEAGNLLIALTYMVGSEKIMKAIQAINKPGLLELLLSYMNNSSFQQSKANIDQSKISLQNSKLQHEFYGPQIAVKFDSKKSLGKNSTQNLNSSDRKQKMTHSKNSRKQSQNMNVDLSYSRQSVFQQSLQNQGSKVSQHHYPQDVNQIKVLQEEEDVQDQICLYCQQRYQNQKQHYIQECKVLAFCQKCSCLIYIREFTDHLLQECQQSHLFRQCKKCGLAFEMGQINEHIGKDTCKKKLGVNWERCQFCGTDILGQDKFWTQHALSCRCLPDKKYTSNRLQHSEQENQSSNYQ